MEPLSVVWEAKMRCVKFWLKVLNNEMYEGRLLRKIARRAIECGKGIWVKNMAKCVGAWRKVRSMLIKETKAGDDDGNCGR